MPDRSQTFVPVPERIAALLADDIRLEGAIDAPALIAALAEREWQMHQIEAYLGRAVLIAWERSAQRRDGSPALQAALDEVGPEPKPAPEPKPGDVIPVSDLDRLRQASSLVPRRPPHDHRDTLDPVRARLESAWTGAADEGGGR